MTVVAQTNVNDCQEPKTRPTQIERYLWAAFAVWTGVVVLSLAWNLVQVSKDTLELARLQARVAYDKDVLYRRWNAEHSPVYGRASCRVVSHRSTGEQQDL